ncbi:MAG TPA: alpha/beta hydrolase [Chloroflexota bacterium]|nr:alpha/beta hydrolase [Chloroflexota bacterium]
MATFVIVHGAWGGAWSWNKIVVPMLRKAGHDVYPVTLTGLGERAHLGTPETDLDTHIEDVCNVLFYEDLHDVILAGHSYGGMVITGVADRVPERLSQLVYLDAAVPADGESLADGWSPERRLELLARAQREPDGWRMGRPQQPPNPPEIAEWALARRVGHPLQTFLQPIRLTRGETTLPRTFVYCSADKEPGSPGALRAEKIKADPRWRFFELPTLHNLMYHAPAETVEILGQVAAG